jgi:hypothetical protein
MWVSHLSKHLRRPQRSTSIYQHSIFNSLVQQFTKRRSTRYHLISSHAVPDWICRRIFNTISSTFPSSVRDPLACPKPSEKHKFPSSGAFHQRSHPRLSLNALIVLGSPAHQSVGSAACVHTTDGLSWHLKRCIAQIITALGTQSMSTFTCLVPNFRMPTFWRGSWLSTEDLKF